MYCVMDVFCEKGLHVAIDDDFTADYDEYVIGLVAKEFSMQSSYIWSDVINQFRVHEQFERDRDIMLKQLIRWWTPECGEPYPLQLGLVAND